MNHTDQILQDIRDELSDAREKFPTNRHLLTAFNEEAGELNKAMLECEYDRMDAMYVYIEAIQAAAMAIRVALEGDHSFQYDPRTILSDDTDEARTEA